MQIERWTNQAHPQTLHIGVFLLYFSSVFPLLALGARGLLSHVSGPIPVLATLAMTFVGIASAVGIASNKLAAWFVAVTLTTISICLWLSYAYFGNQRFGLQILLMLAFPVAQLALLVHPMSRSYVKQNFT